MVDSHPPTSANVESSPCLMTLDNRSQCVDNISHMNKVPSLDRKSTRLNSSHSQISYAVFCLKKKKHNYAKKRPVPRVPSISTDASATASSFAPAAQPGLERRSARRYALSSNIAS